MKSSNSTTSADNQTLSVDFRSPQTCYYYVIGNMRRNDLVLNTYHHVLNRGARNLNIVQDEDDKWQFIRLLYYLNDSFKNENWKRELHNLKTPMLQRPSHWPERDPLVCILGFCLLDNHFHLLVKEIVKNGLSQFMQRMPNSMSRSFNKKYGGSGSIFQGSYKSRLVETDADLRNVSMYIMVKNVFERFPGGGIPAALKNFDKAWQWALNDPFSSFADYAKLRQSPVVSLDLLADHVVELDVFKREVFEYLKDWKKRKLDIVDFALE